MYQRRILCTLYGTVDFLIVPSKGLYMDGGAGAGRLSSFTHLLSHPPPPPSMGPETSLKPPSWALHLLGLSLANICVCTRRYAGMHTLASPGWALVQYIKLPIVIDESEQKRNNFSFSDELTLRMFLRGCKYSLERTKVN